MSDGSARLELSADAPQAPEAADREWMLDALAELIERGGAGPLLAPPVEPGPAAFPEPWRPTRAGVTVVARRCAAHAGLDGIEIDVIDARPSPTVDAKRATELEVDTVAPDAVTLVLHTLGTDDIAGTTCHVIGAVIAATARLVDAGPFRVTGKGEHAGTDDDTRRRGAVAAVWAGLGVLAANAAYQQYNRHTPINGYAPIDYRVIRAGAVPMSALAFLVAVQVELRGGDVPGGLHGPQRDEVRAWRRALAGRRAVLRDRLGIALDAATRSARPALVPIEDEPDDDAPTATSPGGHPVFRTTGHAGGLAAVGGMIVGGIALGAAIGSGPFALLGGLGGGVAGYAIGKRRRHDRCADCDITVPPGASTCPRCRGVLGRTIRHRNDRLAEAEKDAGEGEA